MKHTYVAVEKMSNLDKIGIVLNWFSTKNSDRYVSNKWIIKKREVSTNFENYDNHDFSIFTKQKS